MSWASREVMTSVTDAVFLHDRDSLVWSVVVLTHRERGDLDDLLETFGLEPMLHGVLDLREY